MRKTTYNPPITCVIHTLDMGQLERLLYLYKRITLSRHPRDPNKFYIRHLQPSDLTEKVSTVKESTAYRLREPLYHTLLQVGDVTISMEDSQFKLWYEKYDPSTVDLTDCYRKNASTYYIRGEEVGWMKASLILTKGIHKEIREELAGDELDLSQVKIVRWERNGFNSSAYPVFKYGNENKVYRGFKGLGELFPEVSEKVLKEYEFPSEVSWEEDLFEDLLMEWKPGGSRGKVLSEGGKVVLENPNQLRVYLNDHTTKTVYQKKAERMWSDLKQIALSK